MALMSFILLMSGVAILSINSLSGSH
uniref:Uncharacterized protein n=1 Tax=Lepeophtheirus salmonis TaxID=72036 RepID=A0A0K2VKA5_LEPSM